MKTRMFFGLALAMAFCLGASGVGSGADDTEAKKLAESQSAAYLAAFNKKDAAGIGVLFTPDAQYTSETGEEVSGREAIIERVKASFAARPKSDLALVVESARFITPGVLVEKGLATVTEEKDAEPESTHYTATHVKTPDGWLIAELIEVALPPEDPSAAALASLDWLVGSWKADPTVIQADMKATWALDDHFITRTINITREGGVMLTIVEVIGYDRESGQIRSWSFDNEGGFGESVWRQEGEKWFVNFKATQPGGGVSSCENVLTLVDKDHYTVESINRAMNGEVLPNLDPVPVQRVPDEETQPAGKK